MKTFSKSLLVLFFASALAIAAPTKTTMEGWVTNTSCDARAMKADAAACMRKCNEKGQVQFVDDAQHKVWDVSNPQKLHGFFSSHVTLEALPDAAAKKLEVLSVKKSPESKAAH